MKEEGREVAGGKDEEREVKNKSRACLVIIRSKSTSCVVTNCSLFWIVLEGHQLLTLCFHVLTNLLSDWPYRYMNTLNPIARQTYRPSDYPPPLCSFTYSLIYSTTIYECLLCVRLRCPDSGSDNTDKSWFLGSTHSWRKTFQEQRNIRY